MSRTAKWGGFATFSLVALCLANDARAFSTAKCSIAKSRAMSKGVSCLVSRRVRILKGGSADVSACAERIRKVFGKIDSRGGCDLTGDAAAASARAEDIATSILAALRADLAVGPGALRCLEDKTKQLATYSRCEAEAITIRLRVEYRGDREDFAACRSHLVEQFAELEASLPCASNGDAAAAMDEVGGAYGYLPGAVLQVVSQYALGSLLMNADLPHANLTGASLRGNLLDDANLRKADFTNAELINTVFQRSDLTSAVFDGANLYAASLDEALCDGAELGTASLLYLRACNIVGCPATLPPDWQCHDTCLLGPYATLESLGTGMNFDGINLSHAEASHGWFQSSSWIGTNLTAADLDYADLTSSNLSNANFTDAYSRYVLFYGATLDGVDFTSADLSNSRVDGASLVGVTWNNTKCPDGSLSDANGGTCCGHEDGPPPSACSP